MIYGRHVLLHMCIYDVENSNINFMQNPAFSYNYLIVSGKLLVSTKLVNYKIIFHVSFVRIYCISQKC